MYTLNILFIFLKAFRDNYLIYFEYFIFLLENHVFDEQDSSRVSLIDFLNI